MHQKKTEGANLEIKKSRFFLIGLAVALSLTLIAFEWGVYHQKKLLVESDFYDIVLEDELAEITFRRPKRFEPKPQIKQSKSTEISIVEKVEEDLLSKQTVEEYPDFEEMDNYSFGGTEKQVEEELPPVRDAEVWPSFQCSADSESAIFRYLAKHVKYPRQAKEARIQGTVYVEFTINKRGKMVDLLVLRGVGGGCTEEALRVIQSMKDWCPGKNNAIPVGVRFNVPIKFTLK